MRVHKTSQSGGNYPSVWAFEPGPLKVVAIDTGGGLVDINPEGGVVVAVVKAEVTIQDNEGLYIYQSTKKQVQVMGSGFTNDMSVSQARPAMLRFNSGPQVQGPSSNEQAQSTILRTTCGHNVNKPTAGLA